MISPECKNCECLDEDNKEYPCTLDYPLRCNILYSFINEKTFRSHVEYGV